MATWRYSYPSGGGVYSGTDIYSNPNLYDEFYQVGQNDLGSTLYAPKAPEAGQTAASQLQKYLKSFHVGNLEGLNASGYLQQFPDYNQISGQFGNLIAGTQDSLDRDVLGGAIGLDDLWAMSPFLAAAGGYAAAGAEGAAAGEGAAASGAGAAETGLSTELAAGAPAAGLGGAATGGTAAGGGYDLATGAEVITPGSTSGGYGGFIPAVTGGAAGGAAGAATGTALSRIMDGTASAADYLSLAGSLGGTALGVYGANRQAQSLNDLAGKYMEMGAPSRARYEASFAPGFTMANDPGYTDALNQAAKGTLHGLSAKVGNPSDSPNAWAQTLKDLYSGTAYPALQNYRGINANAGGLSRFAEAAPGVATGAINADAGKLNAIGSGVADIFNPPKSLGQILREARLYG